MADDRPSTLFERMSKIARGAAAASHAIESPNRGRLALEVIP